MVFSNEDFQQFVIGTFVMERYRFFAVRAARGRNGASMGVQRGAHCNAVRALQQTNKGLTAERSRLRRMTMEPRPFVCNYE